MNMARPIILTLAIPVIGERVLLGFKKQGLGVGYWNGFGGKVEAGESVETAVRRELTEEAGIVATKMSQQGVVRVVYRDTAEIAKGLGLSSAAVSGEVEIHVWLVSRFEGQVRESAEMTPRWFELEAIPYDQMWPDDQYWLPLLIAGKLFEVNCVFQDERILLSHTLKELDRRSNAWHNRE